MSTCLQQAQEKAQETIVAEEEKSLQVSHTQEPAAFLPYLTQLCNFIVFQWTKSSCCPKVIPCPTVAAGQGSERLSIKPCTFAKVADVSVSQNTFQKSTTAIKRMK